MADDWRPGNLALCVDTGPIPNDLGSYSLGEGLTKGRIYTVAGFGYALDGSDSLCLVLVGDHVQEGRRAARFRKIRPHTPDAEDAETIRLLNGKPAQVPA